MEKISFSKKEKAGLRPGEYGFAKPVPPEKNETRPYTPKLKLNSVQRREILQNYAVGGRIVDPEIEALRAVGLIEGGEDK